MTDKLFTCENDESFSVDTARNRMDGIVISCIVVTVIMAIYMMTVTVNGNRKKNVLPENERQINLLADQKLRSDIIDRNGNIIVTSLPTVNAYVIPKMITVKNEELNIIAERVAKILNLKSKDILPRLKKRKADFVYLKRNIIPKEQYELNKLGYPFIDFERSEKRVYPGNNLFSHIVGALSIDGKGIAGIEKQYDDFLKNGKLPLQLSLDMAIQDTLRRILKKGIKNFNAKAGNAILMDVKTSEIIAMVSLPDYNPNDLNHATDKEMFNRNTLGIYEAGSIFKIFNTAMYLDNGGNIKKVFNTTEPIKIGKRIIRDYIWNKKDLDVTEIMVRSSNLGSARMALEIGGDKQRSFMKKIGFLDMTEIELPEKAKPLIPEKWNKETQTVVATISYGYGLSVSPLHIITAAAGIVNNGKMHKATIIKNKKFPEKKIVSLKTSKQLRDILRTIVNRGSGKRAYTKGYDVGGKTGSARISSRGKYAQNELNTSFLGVFPIYNPKYALLVMLDHPQKKEGDRTNDAGLNSALIAGEIIENIAPQLKIIPKDVK